MKDLIRSKNCIRFNRIFIIYLLVLSAGLAGTTAHATMMTYTVTGESSGDIDGTAFVDASITFTIFGDTDTAWPIYSGATAVMDSGIFVTVGGESYQISDDAYLFRSGSDINGFFLDTSPEPIPMIFWDAISADFDTVTTQNLTWGGSNYLINAAFPLTAIPVDGQSPPVSLTLAANDFHNGTYSAAPVPEPGTALLLGLGLLGLACKRSPTREARELTLGKLAHQNAYQFHLEPWEATVALGHRYHVPVYPCLSASRLSADRSNHLNVTRS